MSFTNPDFLTPSQKAILSQSHEGRVPTPSTPAHKIVDEADKYQAGGSHYKDMQVQPWHAMEAWLTPEEWRGFLKGNIIKYLARANSGKEDHDVMVAKAGHYLDKLQEVLVRQKLS